MSIQLKKREVIEKLERNRKQRKEKLGNRDIRDFGESSQEMHEKDSPDEDMGWWYELGAKELNSEGRGWKDNTPCYYPQVSLESHNMIPEIQMWNLLARNQVAL